MLAWPSLCPSLKLVQTGSGSMFNKSEWVRRIRGSLARGGGHPERYRVFVTPRMIEAKRLE